MSGRREEDAGSRKEVVLSLILRSGVISSAAIIIVGLILMLLTGHSGYGAGFDISKILYYDGGNVSHGFYPTDLQTVLSGLLALKPFALIDLGLVILIATPVMRVAMSTFLFAVEGDWKFVAITAFVLTILILSILLG